ncbi:hypothetical protein [Desulfosporosinus sp. Sb-LF]|uniref:hypothetical protein n=1 Tax=Desulfosporosinus sp. Sb-LF TaxID=2560027 RepID=UPI00107F2715|nr:hypothetical protein [Desulfosporosinus sp. Sb-LF]TGE32645.1 hypothetical protein E4K68_10735 [Desulfosporosinus sp. Sb-LF]
MVEYYSYLWSTTWPNLVVLFLIWGVVVSRLVWKSVGTWRYARDAWGFLLLAGKAFIWVGVLGIYTKLLFFSQPDWLAQPSFIQGSVLEKAYDSGFKAFALVVRSGTEQKQLYVDKNVYDKLKIEDQVKVMYLPTRREVVRCELVGSLL